LNALSRFIYCYSCVDFLSLSAFSNPTFWYKINTDHLEIQDFIYLFIIDENRSVGAEKNKIRGKRDKDKKRSRSALKIFFMFHNLQFSQFSQFYLS
jgi:hypothetical protein